VYTVGHSTRELVEFLGLLRTHGIRQLIDVRRYPASRRYPHFAKESLSAALGLDGVRYRHEPDLGGRRSGRADSPHVAWRSAGFRAYADHMESDEFHRGVEQLLNGGELDQTVVMCSESVWWRCHRRLLADHLELVRGLDVVHLMHDGRRTAHPITDGARRDGDHVVYDVGTTATLDL